MGNRTKRVSSVILLILLVAIIGVQFYILNTNTPYCRDDYSYSYTFAVKENKFRIENFRQVIDSQINHYKVVNGRAVTHTLAQTFLMFDKSVFNAFNTIAFLLLLYLIVYHARGKKTPSPTLFLTAFLSVWFFTPHIGKSYLWLTGACNYLWGILIILLYLVPLTRAIHRKSNISVQVLIILSPLYFLLGLIAGFTNENTAAALLVISTLLIAAITYKRKKFPLWTLSGYTGSICGFLLMLTSPGQSARLDANGGFGDIKVWIDRFLYISDDFFKHHTVLLALVLVFVIIAIIRKRVKSLLLTAIFFVGSLASVYSMILSPYFPLRVWSGPTVLLTVTLVSAVNTAFEGVDFKKFTAVSCVVFSLLGYVYAEDFKTAYNDTLEIKTKVDERVEVINDAKRKGESEVTLKGIKSESRFVPYVYFDDLNNNPDTWPNTAIAMYYGLDKVNKE